MTKLIGMLALSLAIICVISATVVIVDAAKRKATTEIEYHIKEGDSLWGIAELFCPDTMDRIEYISKLMNINNLPDETIYAGDWLKVIICR